MDSARARMGYVLAAVVVVLGLSYPFFGSRLVAAVTPDSGGCRGSGEVPTSSNASQTRRATLCLLNHRRADAGLAPLRRSQPLERAAQRHSEDMGRRHFFAHPNPDGADPARRMIAAGYPASGVEVGENLGWGEETAATPADMVQGWMDSPGHRANILRPRFEEIGIGLAYEAPKPVQGRAAVYTTDFGAPAGPADPERGG